MPIQPRAPSLREKSASNTAQQLARRSAGTRGNWRVRNSRISWRKAGVLGGSVTGSNLKACTVRSAGGSLPGKSRLALFEEGRDGFLVILGFVRERLECRGQLQHIAQTLLLSLAQQALREPQSLRGISSDASRDRLRFAQQLIAQHDARYQAERLRRPRINRVPGQNHFRSARKPDRPSQDPGA